MAWLLSSRLVRRLAVCLLACSPLGLSGCVVKPQWGDEPSSQGTPRELAVVGYAQVKAVPDRAKLSFGVRARNDDPALAMEAVQSKVSKLMNLVQSMGIAKEEIISDQLALHEEFAGGRRRIHPDDEDIWGGLMHDTRKAGKKKSKGYYEALHSVHVHIHDLEKIGALLSAVRKDAANELHYLRFEMADPEPYFNQARKKAVENAKTQAKFLADGAGQEVGEIQSISTSWSRNGMENFGVPEGVAASFLAEAKSGREFPVRPGKMTFTRKVRVTFSLK